MMQKIMMNLTLETCGNGIVLCGAIVTKQVFFFLPFLAKSVLLTSLCNDKAIHVNNDIYGIETRCHFSVIYTWFHLYARTKRLEGTALK